jgi:hypothetical protein
MPNAVNPGTVSLSTTTSFPILGRCCIRKPPPETGRRGQCREKTETALTPESLRKTLTKLKDREGRTEDKINLMILKYWNPKYRPHWAEKIRRRANQTLPMFTFRNRNAKTENDDCNELSEAESVSSTDSRRSRESYTSVKGRTRGDKTMTADHKAIDVPFELLRENADNPTSPSGFANFLRVLPLRKMAETDGVHHISRQQRKAY